MLTPSTTIDLGFATWQPWYLVAMLMQFGYILFGFAFSPSCTCCAICSICTAAVPFEFQVDIAGVVVGSGVDCSNFNATHIIPFSPTGFPCLWDLTVQADCGSGMEDGLVQHQLQNIFGTRLGFVLIESGGVYDAQITKNFGTSNFDCTTISATSYTIYAPLGGTCCNASAATVVVTAL